MLHSSHFCIMFLVLSIGTNAWTIGNVRQVEGASKSPNTWSAPKSSGQGVARNPLLVKTLEPMQTGIEPSYWGITFPTRIEILYTSPHHLADPQATSKEESPKSGINGGKKNIKSCCIWYRRYCL